MDTEPTINRICLVAEGGQGAVTLCHLRLNDEEAAGLTDEGWAVHGLPGDRHLLCISKATHLPTNRPNSRFYHQEVRDLRSSWNRLRREHALLVRAKGLAVPRPYNIVEPDPSRPWEGEFFEEYIDGLTLWEAVRRGLAPSPHELAAFSTAMFGLVGGQDGTSGLPGREIAHRDIYPGQVLIPRVGPGLAWDRPVLLDLGVGYHPDEPLRDADGQECPTTQGLPRTTGWFPPERQTPWYQEDITREGRLHIDTAGDLWGWALVVGFAATGRNLWDVRSAANGGHLVSPEWSRVLAGERVIPPLLPQVADHGLREAIGIALRPDPDERVREEIGARLPLTLLDQLVRARADARAAAASAAADVADEVAVLNDRVGRLESELVEARDRSRILQKRLDTQKVQLQIERRHGRVLESDADPDPRSRPRARPSNRQSVPRALQRRPFLTKEWFATFIEMRNMGTQTRPKRSVWRVLRITRNEREDVVVRFCISGDQITRWRLGPTEDGTPVDEVSSHDFLAACSGAHLGAYGRTVRLFVRNSTSDRFSALTSQVDRNL